MRVDGYGRTVAVNPAWSALTGRTAFDPADIHPEDREVLTRAARRAGAKGEPFQIELRVVRTDGALRWMRATGQVLEPDCIACYCLDVTESVQTIQALRRANLRLTGEIESLRARLVSARHAVARGRLGIPSTGSVPPGGRSRSEPERRPVLIVDDEELVRETTGRVLAESGFEVRLADGAERCLEIMEAESIGVVLLDLVMPGTDVTELVGRIRDAEPELAVVLLSGLDEADARGRLAGQHVAGFVQKPFTRAEIVECVATALAEPQSSPR